MNDTQQSPPGAPPGPSPTSRPSRPDLAQLRRSAGDRRIAGVCGGLGRHLDVDPTLFRVLLAVLVLFGGTGLFVYAALWLLVPDERTGRAYIATGQDLLRWLLVGAGVVAVLMLVGGVGSLGLGMGPWTGPGMGDGMGGGLGGMVGLALTLLVVGGIAVGVLALTRGSARPGASSSTASLPHAASTGVATPAYATPVPPARPRRTGTVLFWPTLAVLAIVIGAMAWADVAGSSFAPGAYGAAALVVIGLALVLGAFVGRPGGLIAAGLVAAVATGIGTVVGDPGSLADARGGQATIAPARVDRLPEQVSFGTGARTLDLQGLDPADLDGRELAVEGYSGQIVVYLPAGLRADVDAEVDAFGRVQAGSFDAGGTSPSYDGPVGRGGATTPTIDLDLDLRFGEIVVVTPEESPL